MGCHNGGVMSHQTAFLFEGIGETDCEAITEGLLAQPVNALSSVAYIIAGLWLVSRAVRNRAAETVTQIVFGLTLSGVGAGSFAFHGPMPPGARLVHDLTIAAVFAVILARGVGSLWRWSEPSVVAGFIGITAAAGAVMALSPGTGAVLSGLVGVAAVGIEVFVYRTGRRGPLSSRLARWLLVIVALLIVAGLVQLLGRTGALLCNPDSAYQAHALWHILTAVAIGLYAFVVFPAREPQGATFSSP